VREIVLDTETTGLDPSQGHRLVEIGCIELVNRIPSGQTFHAYLNPERDMPAEALAIHGLTDEFLKDKPLFTQVVDDLVAFLGDAPLVIHNAAFDTGFLLNHLFLKAFRQPQVGRLYFSAAREFWRELLRGSENAALGDFEKMTLRHLGALMLARIDGKSPVEYIRDEMTKERVRRFAKRLLLEGPRSLEEELAAAQKAVESMLPGGEHFE